MLNQSILSALQEITSFNQFAERNQVERMKVSDLKALRNETENLCEYIEYGLMHLGDLMQPTRILLTQSRILHARQ